MSKSLSASPRAIRGVVLLGLILLLVALGAWWQGVHTSPSHTFNRMLTNSLSSASISKEVNQSATGQQLNQNIQTVLGGSPAVRTINVLKQGSGSTDTTIVTESIGTPSTDYVRYTSISTSQKSPSGKEFDFSNVLNIWGKSDQSDLASGGAQLFNQNLLGVVPYGNLTAAQREQLMHQIELEQPYKVDYSTVQHSKMGVRPAYTYNVELQPEAYVHMLKTFASYIGIHQLDQVDPAQYRDSQPLSFTFAIDAWSGQLLGITYKDSNRTEAYSANGAKLQITPPDTTIGIDELQSRLQSIQQ